MKRLLLIILLLPACSPDTDEIIATADNENFLLPAAPSPDPDVLHSCKDCATENCSKQHRVCQTDDSCKSLLQCKTNKTNPEGLDECNDGVSEQAQKKYQDYFDCVFFLDDKGCRVSCNAGKNLSCSGPDDSQDSGVTGDIELVIRINQIKDMWAEKKMSSPGEHCVCIRWVNLDSNAKETEYCSDKYRDECSNGNLVKPSSKTIGYTNGLGKTVLHIPKNGDGYFQIERGRYTESEALTFDDLGPFIYYIGRRLSVDQEITLYLPQKALEERWAKDYYSKFSDKNDVTTTSEWSFNNGGMITAVAYDCVGAPIGDTSFELTDLEKHDKVYWNRVEGESQIRFDENKQSSSVPGMVTFLYKNITEEKEITITSEIEDTPNAASRKIKIDNNTTTFVALYLYPQSSR